MLLSACLACLLTGLAGCGAPAPDSEAQILETARRAFLDSQFLRAETAYQAYLQSFPQGTSRLEAWKRLADIDLDVRESPDKAAALLEAAVLEYAAQPAIAADLLTTAAELRFSRKDYPKALVLCQAVLDMPNAPQAKVLACYLLAARIDLAQHNDKEALGRYDACRKTFLPQDSTAQCALAQAELLGRLERPAQAESLLQTVFQTATIAPALRAQAGFALGQLYEGRQDKAAARTVYEAVRPLHPNPLVVDKRLESLQN
ncbi:hypothetical protein [Desulfovibrio sp. TomC]|uniref:hypothetical protein n=1 Tax=Desulfovibrio sp. TomC TaxID=1562888 RepID=UPI0005746DCC|nr:hypothetical protein [Desulfovibrio sp. TomC]KHK03021.1 hypothetical protein NY78_1550 [Desulfovibrio sp. TomC]